MQVPRQLTQEGSWDQGDRLPSGNGAEDHTLLSGRARLQERLV